MLKKLTFGNIFIFIGLFLQIITFCVAKDTLLSLICGSAGVLSVVLCSEKRISMYALGFVQLLTYVALCMQQNLYGEISENAFYFVTMIIGVVLWSRNKDSENSKKVKSETLKKGHLILMMVFVILISFLFGLYLNSTNDTHPYLDAFSTIPAFVAQILMMLRYREQWYFWLIVDILTCILWISIGNWCMVAQYVFWTVNCLYGLKVWKY